MLKALLARPLPLHPSYILLSFAPDFFWLRPKLWLQPKLKLKLKLKLGLKLNLKVYLRLPHLHSSRRSAKGSAPLTIGWPNARLNQPSAERLASTSRPRVVLEAALMDLQQEIGGPFKHVVENLIKKWGRSNMYLMEEQSLIGFQSDIEELEGLVRHFMPS
ncbi:hypothetical protein BDD12DRAFT_899676 [Trichophaea hybrida]|nr:hypothetical protein BDD12DRAFT_899676 [Trichophaea hybrida]